MRHGVCYAIIREFNLNSCTLWHLDRHLEESVGRVGRILPLAAIRQRLALRLPPKRDSARLLDGRHQVRRAVVATAPLRTRIYLSAANEHGRIRTMKSHRATGRPRGRPSIIPWDLGEQILCDLESRMDKTNNTVRPDWKGMARRLHVSRSTISREIANLRNSGFIESFSAPIRQGSDILTILYRLKRFA